MARFIALEGLSGVGKSTAAALLAKRLGIEVTKTIPPEFENLRKFISADGTIEARYFVFLAAVVHSARHIEEELQKGSDVVVESYLYRAIAFHEGMGSRFKVQIPKDFLVPTTTILLTCSESERQKRLRHRGEEETKWDALAEQNTQNIKSIYDRFKLQTLDVTRLSSQETVGEILRMVGDTA